MYGKDEIGMIISEYEKALRNSGNAFSEDQIMSLKTAFGMGIMQALILVETKAEAAPSSIRNIK